MPLISFVFSSWIINGIISYHTHIFATTCVDTHIFASPTHTHFKPPMWATVNYSMVVSSLRQYMYIYIPQLVDLHYNIYDKKTHVGPTLFNLSTTLYITIYRTVLEYILLTHLHQKVALTTKMALDGVK